jgi:predicted Zn finger-like uncharacterized protein
MILTCPECATSYFVDDLRIPRGGRMVKCTTCGARWRAFQDRSTPEEAAQEDELLVEARPPARPDGDLEFVAAPAPPPRKPEPKKPAALYVGVGLVAFLAVTLGAAVVLRQQVVGLAPGTAPLFAALGLPVNTLGLVIEGVKSQALLQGGRPVLSVTGAIRSIRKEAAEAPPIRISLLDKGGKPVTGLLVQPLNGRLPPGATRYFAVSLPDPPAGATELEVAFELPAKGAAPHPAPAAPAAQGPAPLEAQALSPDSPDALAKHE